LRETSTYCELHLPRETVEVMIAGGRALALNDILSIIHEVTGLQPAVKYPLCRRLDVSVHCADNHLAKKGLGWQPEPSWDEGIKMNMGPVKEPTEGDWWS
jgi:nucleoside-diphosphate-sugar epimerase